MKGSYNRYLLEINSGINSKIQFPASEKIDLAIVQQYIVFQILISQNASFSFELVVTDTTNTKRRINFTSSTSNIDKNYFHARVPVDSIKKGVWLNLSIDTLSFMELFKGNHNLNICLNLQLGFTFRSLDMLAIYSSCKLRKIFSMKNPIYQSTEDPDYKPLIEPKFHADDIPKQHNFPQGIYFYNQVICFQSIVLYETIVKALQDEQQNLTRSGHKLCKIKNEYDEFDNSQSSYNAKLSQQNEVKKRDRTPSPSGFRKSQNPNQRQSYNQQVMKITDIQTSQQNKLQKEHAFNQELNKMLNESSQYQDNQNNQKQQQMKKQFGQSKMRQNPWNQENQKLENPVLKENKVQKEYKNKKSVLKQQHIKKQNQKNKQEQEITKQDLNIEPFKVDQDESSQFINNQIDNEYQEQIIEIQQSQNKIKQRDKEDQISESISPEHSKIKLQQQTYDTPIQQLMQNNQNALNDQSSIVSNANQSKIYEKVITNILDEKVRPTSPPFLVENNQEEQDSLENTNQKQSESQIKTNNDKNNESINNDDENDVVEVVYDPVLKWQRQFNIIMILRLINIMN